jgi:D-aspartate ligase
VVDVTRESGDSARLSVDIGWHFDARDGQYKALDVNPRLGATFRLFVDPSGLDVVRCMYLHLTGQPIPPARAAAGRKWLSLDRDLVSSFRYWRDGWLTVRAWLRSIAGVQELAWCARDDRGPFFARWREILGKAARRVAGLGRPSQRGRGKDEPRTRRALAAVSAV